jgi:membrane-associated protease RseP (regulator of RpoE activity)
VEPDEEEFERTKGISKIRMLGAGITNNMAAGLICFCFLVLLLGMAVPVQVPLIKAVYQDYPAAAAGVPADSLIRSVNGIAVTTSDDVSTILNTTRPGDKAALVIEKEGNLMTYDLTLGRWPDILGARQSGFMGVSYYQAAGMKEIFNQLASPLGFVSLLGIPIWVIMYPVEFGNFMILLNTTVDSAAWVVPFPHYWLVVQIIFWCAWFNITVGLCNAIPMVPFDGGYILKEGVERFLEPRGLLKYSGHVVIAISYIMVAILALGFSLPLLYRAMGIS